MAHCYSLVSSEFVGSLDPSDISDRGGLTHGARNVISDSGECAEYRGGSVVQTKLDIQTDGGIAERN